MKSDDKILVASTGAGMVIYLLISNALITRASTADVVSVSMKLNRGTDVV
jgi:hypothetical protein